jgi:hypothetical protein
VIVPAGSKVKDLDELTVKADDGKREYEAATDKATFELHLPAHAYTLTASVDELVGVVEVRARPAMLEEVTITLQPAVAIEVNVEVPAGAGDPVVATAVRAGTDFEVARAEEEEHHLRIGGLLRGDVYDVTVRQGAGKTVIRGVRAPATLDVTLGALATLHGMIGFPAGTKCAFRTIAVVDDDDDDEGRSARVDRNCRFQLGALDPGTTVHLRASAPGWHLEELVAIPAQGEPDPVCLNPPCRDLPPVDPATLEVILTGSPSSGIIASIAQEREEHGCSSDGSSCEIGDLVPGAATKVGVDANECGHVEQEVVLQSGKNTVRVPCLSMRVVEGVARGSDRGQRAYVHCQDGTQAVLQGSSVFELKCPREGTEILYRLAGHGWRRAPVPPGVDPAFVELTL